MKVDRITIREIRLPLVHFFETSFGRVYERQILLVEIKASGLSGWGECVAGEGPFYSYETVRTAWAILTEFILAKLVRQSVPAPEDFEVMFKGIRGHRMAKAAVEAALWDLSARRAEMPLWKVLGGGGDKIACGVSIGIQDHPDLLLEKVDKELKAGYKKIKIKIKPGWDLEIVRLVRRDYPNIALMVDANSAYALADAEHLKQFDAFDLMMIEQPLGDDDIVEHSKLQPQLKTPICLDESIRHSQDAVHAIELGACRIINIKMGRVGGHLEAIRVHDACQARGVPVWCGGMLETGIGRAHNIALSTLENFTLPGDVSASRRYYERDVIYPPVEVTPDGYILPPKGPGLGYEVDKDRIERITIQKQEFQ